MDIVIPVVLFIIFFIMFSICGYCCKRNKQGIVYGTAPNAQVVTATTTTSYNTSNAPYPIDTSMPQPVSMPAAPPAGFAAHAAYPPTTPYPPAPGGLPPGFHPMPMPMMGGYTGNTPYPPMPVPGSGAYTAPVPPYPVTQQQPPSYAEATQQPPRTVNEGYVKQSPYNPSYN